MSKLAWGLLGLSNEWLSIAWWCLIILPLHLPLPNFCRNFHRAATSAANCPRRLCGLISGEKSCPDSAKIRCKDYRLLGRTIRCSFVLPNMTFYHPRSGQNLEIPVLNVRLVVDTALSWCHGHVCHLKEFGIWVSSLLLVLLHIQPHFDLFTSGIVLDLGWVNIQ